MELAVPIKIGLKELKIDDTTFTQTPLHVSQSNLTAREWTWNGLNVSAARSPFARTVGEQVRELHQRWLRDGLRALRADELIQLAEYSEQWPAAWRHKAGSRIFFAGTVYEVRFSSHTEMHIYAARFDAASNEWWFGCESFDEPLHPHDQFACIYMDPSEEERTALSWSQSFNRRTSFVDRPHMQLMRYGS